MIKPKFVKMDILRPDGFLLVNAMRLIPDGKYYRDAGRYSIGVIEKDGKLFAVSPGNFVIHDKELYVCSFEEWKNDNGRYAPKHIKE